MCAGQCKESREFCEQACRLSQRGCVNDVQKQALKDYEMYMREQLRERQHADLRLSDFEAYDK